jgi:hypothetical protein
MLLCELVKPVDGLAEGAGMLDMFPSQSSQARYELSINAIRRALPRHKLTAKGCDWSIDGFDEDLLAMQLSMYQPQYSLSLP